MRLAAAVSLIACGFAAAFANADTGAADQREPAPRVSIQPISAITLAKLKPGLTKAQVKRLLGAPWRTIQYNDVDAIENEIWEYRGRESTGTYRIHIEFDQQGMVAIVGKIPDGAPGAKGTAAAS